MVLSVSSTGGLDETVDEAILHAAFIPFGEIKEVQIPKDNSTQKNRGFGFVDFEEVDDAAAAMDNMNSELAHCVIESLTLLVPQIQRCTVEC